MLDTFLGNEQFKGSLLAALRAGRLSHSLLFCGENGTGAGYAARCLAADFLYPNGGDGARLVMQNQCPEYIRIEGEGASGDIKIDRVRAVRREIFNTAMSAGGRVVHIVGADKMNASSANALLKVLEEPPENVLFILTAPSEAAVLPTLRSRCCIYAVSPVSESVCAAYLKQHFPTEKYTQKLSAVFGGKIGAAVRCLSDAAAKAQFADAEALAALCNAADEYGSLALLAKYEKDRAAARSFLVFFAQICAAALRGAYPALTAEIAARALPFVGEASAQIAANVSQKLVMTQLGIKLAA